jgi:hypothetical protein
MANSVALVRRVKTDNGWRRYPVAYGKTAGFGFGYVQVVDKQVFFEQGSYELRWYQNRQPRYESAGEIAS